MTLMEGLARQTTWAGRSMIHNLKLLPAGKLDWRPAPTASSALDIVNHLAYWLIRMDRVLDQGEWCEPEFTPATDLPSAIALIAAGAEQHAAIVSGTVASDPWRMVRLPWGELPVAEVGAMVVVDLMHHHGQIVYLQALLGDEEIHLFEGGWGTVLRGSRGARVASSGAR
jgi:hypothetical protein